MNPDTDGHHRLIKMLLFAYTVNTLTASKTEHKRWSESKWCNAEEREMGVMLLSVLLWSLAEKTRAFILSKAS